jgi:hypothetical protein
MTRFLLLVLAALTASAVPSAVDGQEQASAPAFTFLVDVPGEGGCVAQTGVRAGLRSRRPEDDGCARGRGLREVHHVALSADERFLYAASGTYRSPPRDDGALTIFTRDPTTGEVRQLPGAAGCIKRIDPPLGAEGCAQARQLIGLRFVTVSGDNRHLYTGSYEGIAVFRRDVRTGIVEQVPGPTGCVRSSTADCLVVPRAVGVEDITFSRDGRFAYAATKADAVITFRRDPESGTLRPLLGKLGCIADARGDGHCTAGRALRGARSVTLSPDERFAYVAAIDDAVAIFRRDRQTGALTQLPDESGCLSETGRQKCTRARGLQGPHRVTITRDGRFAYVAGKRGAERGSALAVFHRNVQTGGLTQFSGADACFTEDGSDGCARGRVLRGAHAALLDGSERTLYVSSDRSEGGIAIFRRDPSTGQLQQLPGELGCMAPIQWQGCRFGRRTGGIHFLAMTRDGRFAYAAGETSYAVIGYRLVGQ